MSVKFFHCGNSGGDGDAGLGVSFHRRFQTQTIINSTVTLLSYTTGLADADFLKRVVVTSSVKGRWFLEVGGSVEASGNTAPGHPDSDFPFDDNFEVGSSVLVELKFTQLFGSSSDIDGYLMGATVT